MVWIEVVVFVDRNTLNRELRSRLSYQGKSRDFYKKKEQLDVVSRILEITTKVLLQNL